MSRENSLTLHQSLKYSRDPSTTRPSVFSERRLSRRSAQDDRSFDRVHLAISFVTIVIPRYGTSEKLPIGTTEKADARDYRKSYARDKNPYYFFGTSFSSSAARIFLIWLRAWMDHGPAVSSRV